ncbi:hypothetical protein WN943_002607 [Citrus x changshan-huyou]
MASCFLQEIGLADDVLVDEQDILAPAPPDTRLLRDRPVRRTLPSNIYSSCLREWLYIAKTRVKSPSNEFADIYAKAMTLFFCPKAIMSEVGKQFFALSPEKKQKYSREVALEDMGLTDLIISEEETL